MPFNEQFTVFLRPSLNDTFENSYGTPFNDCGWSTYTYMNMISFVYELL